MLAAVGVVDADDCTVVTPPPVALPLADDAFIAMTLPSEEARRGPPADGIAKVESMGEDACDTFADDPTMGDAAPLVRSRGDDAEVAR
jgi:hypothetical protein